MSLRIPRLTAGILLCMSIALHAQDAAPAKTDAAPAYQLKNRSKFTVAPGESPRPPFWPVGWVKRKVAANNSQAPVAPVVHVLLDEKSFKVTSILIGTGTTPSLAVINGRAYSEGEFVRMPKGTPVRVRVQRITDGSVTLQNADQMMVAPLARPELSNKRPEEMLLDPDR